MSDKEKKIAGGKTRKFGAVSKQPTQRESDILKSPSNPKPKKQESKKSESVESEVKKVVKKPAVSVQMKDMTEDERLDYTYKTLKDNLTNKSLGLQLDVIEKLEDSHANLKSLYAARATYVKLLKQELASPISQADADFISFTFTHVENTQTVKLLTGVEDLKVIDFIVYIDGLIAGIKPTVKCPFLQTNARLFRKVF